MVGTQGDMTYEGDVLALGSYGMLLDTPPWVWADAPVIVSRYVFGTVAANVHTEGGYDWINPDGALTDNDGSMASAVMYNHEDHTSYLKVSGFNFNFIPHDSTIVAVEVMAHCFAPHYLIRDYCYLVKADGTLSDDRPYIYGDWHPDMWLYHGGPRDLWGLTWTVDEIKDSGFGVLLGGALINNPPPTGEIAGVDAIKVSVSYMRPGGFDGHHFTRGIGRGLDRGFNR